MGLDMYLNAKRYISPYEDGGPELAAEIQKQFPELEGKFARWGNSSPVKEVRVEVGYWRKANAIHKWFVDNVQGGDDDCRSYYVERKQLGELKGLCEQVLANKDLAATLLPAQSGFFFGSTEYNEGYFQDLEQTIKIIDGALTLPNSWDIEYDASW